MMPPFFMDSSVGNRCKSAFLFFRVCRLFFIPWPISLVPEIRLNSRRWPNPEKSNLDRVGDNDQLWELECELYSQ